MELVIALLFGALVAAVAYYTLVRPLKMQIDRMSNLLTILAMQREQLIARWDALEPTERAAHRQFVVAIYEQGIRKMGIVDRNMQAEVVGVISGKTPMPLPEERS